MLCRHCYSDTWEGTRCLECGRRLSTQKSIKTLLIAKRDAAINRRRSALFALGLVAAIVGAPWLRAYSLWVAIYGGLLCGWLLCLIGVLQPYEDCYPEFWETYGSPRRVLGPMGQAIIDLLCRDGLTNFLILELCLLLWNAAMWRLMGPDYDAACLMANGAAAMVAWVGATFLRRTWY